MRYGTIAVGMKFSGKPMAASVNISSLGTGTGGTGTYTIPSTTAISTPTNFTATNTTFNGPCALIFDSVGNLIVADTLAHRIRKIITSGTTKGTVSTIAGRTGGHINGNGEAVAFTEPKGLIYDTKGNLYIADSRNCCIRRVNPDRKRNHTCRMRYRCFSGVWF